MSFTLEYQKTDTLGNFKACGVGLNYEFSSQGHLNVFLGGTRERLLSVATDDFICSNPRLFVEYFDKMAQILALIFSNHMTVYLPKTIHPDRLRGVLTSLYDQTLLTLKLKEDRLKEASEEITELYGLKQFNLTHLKCATGTTSPYYRIKLKTYNHNELTVRSVSLHGILMTTSEKIARDLIMLEFSTKNSSAHDLLALSTRLTTLSRVLDKNFYPQRKITVRKLFMKAEQT